MSIRKYYPKVGQVFIEKLHTEIRAICAIDGVAFDGAQGQVGVDYVDAPSSQLEIQVAAAITNHDATDYEAIATETDKADFASTLASSLAALDSDETAIASDLTALAAAGTFAAAKPILQRTLERQTRTIVGFRRIVKVLRHLI